MMNEPNSNIKQGFLWLGTANIAAQIFDVISSVLILIFLSKTEIGLATLAWSFAVIVESFNGLGVGTSMLQKKDLPQKEVNSLFWFSTGFSIAAFLLIVLLSPMISIYYNSPELSAMMAVSALKLPIVGAMLVPLQLLNRDLKYKQIGAAQTVASFLSSVTKIGLAASGLGAWSLVIAHVSSGIFMFIGVLFFSSFYPVLYFKFPEIKEHIVFGSRVTFSGVIYHIYRNADYLIIGKLLGNEALGVYRVAFDIAMTPAMALLNVVNRASFPVFSRISSNRDQLAKTFIWTQKNLTFFIAPLSLFIIFTAGDIIAIAGKEKWAEAVPAIQILAVAAFMRTVAQTFPQLFHAVGRPAFAVYDSLMTFFLSVSFFLFFISFFKESMGILSACIAWFATYPLAIAFLIYLTRKVVPVTFFSYIATFKETLTACAVVVPLSGLILFYRSSIPWGIWLHPLLQGAIILTVFGTFFKLSRKVSIKSIFKGSGWKV